MKLREGIKVDIEATFGELKFMGDDGVRYDPNDPDRQTILNRRYNLKSRAQEQAVTVYLDKDIPEKDFAYNTPVELKDVTIDQFSANGRDAVIMIFASDIVPAGGNNEPKKANSNFGKETKEPVKPEENKKQQ
ncbi:DUF961 family protein [Oceanobacillus oncorhynchi subsp. oncorhynchi]|uniref:DUF961 family protein n=1 Tax=Oceanobacillus oncorhynchi TaxID=545501 RepID=UPI003638AB0B